MPSDSVTSPRHAGQINLGGWNFRMVVMSKPTPSIIPPTPDVGPDPTRCGAGLVAAGRLTHAEQPQLDAAVEGARRRPIGQAGAFGWDRRDGAVFVAPLVACTLARFGAVTAGRRHTGQACFV